MRHRVASAAAFADQAASCICHVCCASRPANSTSSAWHGMSCRMPVLQAAEGTKQGTAGAATAVEDVVKALRLTPVQCQTLAWIRERQLKKMAALADARRELNMRVRRNNRLECGSCGLAVTVLCVTSRGRV